MRWTFLRAFGLFLLPTTILVRAQPVIDVSWINSTIGSTRTYASPLSETVVDAGPNGADQYWDFSFIPDTLVYSTTVTDASTSPGSSSYLEANHCDMQVFFGTGATRYHYSLLNSDSSTYFGDHLIPPGVDEPYVDPLVFMYPFNFGDAQVDSWEQAVSFGGITTSFSGTDSSTYDAYGTLVLSSGIFTDVVRIKATSTTQQTLSVANTTYYSSTTSYEWSSRSVGASIFAIANVSTWNSDDPIPQTSQTVRVLRDWANTIEEHGSIGEVVLYPNPNQGQFTLRVQDAQWPVLYRVFDLQGRLLRTGRLMTETSTIDLAHAEPGTYTIQFDLPNRTYSKGSVVIR